MTEESTETDLGPGQQLKLARERKGLTVADISTRLKLNTWMIEGIEQDDYDKLPSPTFLRGYLRSYAALVDLDGDELVRAYNRRANFDVKPLSMEQPEVPAPAPPVPVAKYVLILLLLGAVLFATYWFALRGTGELDDDLGEDIVNLDMGDDIDTDTDNAVTTPNGAGLGQPVIIADGSAGAAAIPIAQPVPLADSLNGVVVTPLSAGDIADPTNIAGLEPAGGSADAATSPSAADGNSESAAGAASLEGSSGQDGASVEGSLEGSSAGDNGDTEQPVVDIQPAEAGYVRLNFTLAEKAWMQIRERRNKRLVSRELDAGDHEFVGRLPVRMTIGNAKTVTLLVDGQPWDIPKRNVARIKIFKKPVAE